MKPPEFDHRPLGTSEMCWLPVVDQLPDFCVSTLGSSVTIVSPHPDDEILAVGGLMQQLVRRGVDVRVVSLTNGEAANIADAGLGSVRREELRRAVRRVGLPADQLVHADLADGELHSSTALLDRISALGGRPSAWLAPLPIDGHSDHDAAGRATAAAARGLGGSVWFFAVWAWHWAMPAHLPLHRATKVQLSPEEVACKHAAIAEFRSQLDGADPILGPHVLARFQRSTEVLFE